MSYSHFSTDCRDYHDLVVDFHGHGTRPTITVLCGSTRFSDTFREQTLRLTLAGHIVLSIGCDLRSDIDMTVAREHGPDLETVKQRLDELHKRKIDLADEVFVLNVCGYVGDSTRREIEYATKLGKRVWFLENSGDDWVHVTPKGGA